jgi:lysophospholipase L1-like esterase
MRLPSLLLVAAVVVLVRAADSTPAPNMTSPTVISARDPRIAYMGRLVLSDDGARLGFPGVTVRFMYRGPAPTLRLSASSPNCFFNLACNGWDPAVIRLNQGDNEIPLPTGAAPVQGWLIELVRRTESWQGVAVFQGLVLPPGGELLSPPPWPERRLLFIGDSITSGEYLDRMPPEYDNTPRMADAPRAFGMLLGRWLHAQVHLVSYGGRGVMRDWQGKTDVANAPQFFPRALPDDPSARWDHANYTPDAIVVCLGQNDFSKDLLDEAIYTDAYARFIADIRQAHPAAALILAEDPMFGDAPGTLDRAKRDQLRRTLEAVAARRHAAGDRRITVATVHHYPGTAGNAHQVAFQHEQIALELLGPIRALTGW